MQAKKKRPARAFVSIIGAAALGRPRTWRKAGETGRRGRRPLRDGAKNGRGAETAGGASPSPTETGVAGCGTCSGTSGTPSPTGVDRTRPRNRGRLIAAPTGTDAGWRVSNTGRRGRRPLRDGCEAVCFHRRGGRPRPPADMEEGWRDGTLRTPSPTGVRP